MNIGFRQLQLVIFKSYILLSSLDDAFEATLEAFRHERPDCSPGGVAVSTPTVPSDDKGD